MKERITAILEENIFSEKVFFFRRVIYLVVLWNSISWGLDASQFFGPERLQLSYPAYSKLDMLLNILCHSDWQSGYLVVLGVNILFLLLGFFSILPRFSSVMIFLSTAMMFRAGHELTNGGHQLMSILLGYNLLMSERGNESFYANVVSNLVVFLAMFQVVCVYLFAGLFKLQGNMWLSGSALYQVLSLKTYSHPIFYGLMHETFLLKGVNYIGLVYQLMFPFLIWSKRLRLPLLVLGMLFHLFIVFGMGLPAFGIFMMASYSIFASKSFAVSFGEKFNALLSRLKLFV